MKVSLFIALFIALCAQNAHSALTTIKCQYHSFASIQKVEPTTEVMQLTFTVDIETSDAKVIRKSGITDVELYPTGGGFTFVEINQRGNVLTTTVDIHGKSAHSRNTIIDTDLIPSQFYGSCDYER